MSWLIDKGNGKAYGSIVIYVTKGGDARRLLEGRYFHLAGESAKTSVFEPKVDTVQCYNCWGLGHKAYSWRHRSVADAPIGGHYHRQCQATASRCL